MKLRQLFDPATSTYTYLLWDEVSRQAALLDTVREQVERDVKLLQELDLTLRYTLETHIHADHVTGAALLRERLGSRAVAPAASGVECADLLVKHGDTLSLGKESIRVLSLPGHTDADVGYAITGAVFTGDALLIRGTGRTDFQSGDPGALYDSITQHVFTLPDDTQIYPGHDYNGQSVSSVGEERAHNPRLAGRTREEFVALMNSLQFDPPQRIDESVPGNQRCGAK